MKKINEKEFQIMFFKNLIKKIVKSYVFEDKNLEKIYYNKKGPENTKIAKFNKLNDENARKLAEKFVLEMRIKGKTFESVLKDEKKLIKWVLDNIYPVLEEGKK